MNAARGLTLDAGALIQLGRGVQRVVTTDPADIGAVIPDLPLIVI